MAAPAALAPLVKAALKKIAVAAATDKRVGKTVLGIIGGVLFVVVAPILMLLSLLQGGADLDLSAAIAQAQHEQLVYFEQIMLSIEDEITEQELDIDPLRAQIIFLSALSNHPRDADFFTNYIMLFAGEQDVFEAIGETFGVTFTAEEIEQLEQLIAWAQEAQTGPPSNLHNRIVALAADDDTPFGGVFSSPLRDRDWRPLLTSGFGIRTHPISGERSHHAGIDLSLPVGTEIYAVAAGRVLIVAYDPHGYGLYVVIYHGGGMATLYAHCSRILVNEGQEVTPETVIAHSGNSGLSRGPHLHFELIENGRPINPTRHLPR